MEAAGIINDRPRHVVWEVRHAGSRFAGLGRAQRERLIDEVAAIAPHQLTLAGDLAACDDLLELIARANDRGLTVDLQPAVTPQFLRLDFGSLRDAGARRLTLGIHGSSAASHGGQRGSWERALPSDEVSLRAEVRKQASHFVAQPHDEGAMTICFENGHPTNHQQDHILFAARTAKPRLWPKMSRR